MRYIKHVTRLSILVSALITLSMAAMTLGAGPAGAAPFAYVTNLGSNNVSVISTASNTVVGNPIPVGSQPVGVAITPNWKFAYVANFGSNDVSVIATASNTVVGNPIPVGTAPLGVAITHQQQRHASSFE